MINQHFLIMDTYKFDIPRHHKSIIKVIGVGGGGSNAVNHMYAQGIKDVEFVVCNTDSQALKISSVPNRLQIGPNLTEGLGAGANPGVGRDAALENKEEIRDLLGMETKMVFITAGMGGGTGTGAAPVIAQIARDMGILTVGIITAPFSFEGKKKMSQAQEGMRELRENCDTVLVILNDKLREIFGNLTINNAFAQADNVLTTAAKGIAEIITVAGYVNVDFQDVRTVMANAGAAVMGSSETSGDNRATRAAEEALASPLLDNKDINGAQNILLSIISGEEAELQMDELSEITEYIQQQAGDQAEVIFGHGVDPELEDRIRVTVIATGFDSEYMRSENIEETKEEVVVEKTTVDLEEEQQIPIFEHDNPADNKEMEKREIPDYSQYEVPAEEEDVAAEIEAKNESHENQFDMDSVPLEESNDDGPIFDRRGDDFFSNETDDAHADEVLGTDGMMSYRGTKERLEQQALERTNALIKGGKADLNTQEFKEKLDVPAYLRKKVKLENTPHSSENNISKFKLNDENQLLGNNKFLHDNVD